MPLAGITTDAVTVNVPGRRRTVGIPFEEAQFNASLIPFVEVGVPLPAEPGVAFEVESEPKSAPELAIVPLDTVMTGFPAAAIALQLDILVDPQRLTRLRNIYFW